MRLKVYIVVTPFFPSSSQWQGAYCFDFVRALERTLNTGDCDAWKVLVFKPGQGDDYEYQGVKVYRFPTRQLPSGLFPHLFDRWNQRSFLRKLHAVLAQVEPQPQNANTSTSSIAVCHAHTRDCVIYPCAVKTLNLGCLTLMHHHDPGSVGVRNGRFHRFWLQRLSILLPVRKYYESIDCHVFISKMVEKSFRMFPDTGWTPYEDYRWCGRGFGWMKPFKVKRSIVLHNGVDNVIFRPAMSSLKRPTSAFTIGCVANLEDWKDPLTLVRACVLVQKQLRISNLQSSDSKHQTSTIKLRVVGSGRDVPKMKRLAAASGLDLEIRTEVDHTRLPAFYHSLDLFVLPSYFEGFGCVFTEAYASGVPFITCEGQGMDDYLKDEDRGLWLCRARNPDDLAAKILYNIRHRPQQRLDGEISIMPLVAEFARKLLDL